MEVALWDALFAVLHLFHKRNELLETTCTVNSFQGQLGANVPLVLTKRARTDHLPFLFFFADKKSGFCLRVTVFACLPTAKLSYLVTSFVQTNPIGEREIWKLTNGKGIISQHSVIDFPLEISQSIQSIAIALEKVCV